MWPLSRRQQPKQFSPLLGDEPLFTATLRRMNDRRLYEAPIVVGNLSHRFFILEALDALGITDATVLLEPVGRNTAAATLAAALHEADKSSDALHLVLPSDHIILDAAPLHAAVAATAQAAANGSFVLFGIPPERPETGYGYILPEAGESSFRPVARFREKPEFTQARMLIAKGALWNSGIFFYDPCTLLKEAELLASDHLSLCRKAWQHARTEGKCTLLADGAYSAMDHHAFDTLFLERTQRGMVATCKISWSDVGNWEALRQLTPKNDDGNVFIGSVVAKDVKTSYIRSEGPMVAILGMEECTVIATKDAVLVASNGRAQDIKHLLTSVEAERSELAQDHMRVPRPWGTYENIAEGHRFKVKHIVVKPGRSLSLQMHRHRAEHWVVVSGTAKVECDGTEKIVLANESVFIPKGSVHRLSNPGTVDLQIIEVQSGDKVSEDDIVRFEDIYGRS